MATLDLSKPASGFDMTDPDLVGFGSTVAATPTAWTYLTPAGTRVRVTGTGMTFDAAGRPTGGTATAIEIDVKNDSYPELVITGISTPAATLDDGPASFWRFLEGDDVILGPEAAQGAAEGIFRMFGDGLAARNGATGGRDIIHLGDRISAAMGDVWTVGFPAAVNYRGGNDEILGLATNAVQYAYGDAGLVYGGSRLTGGNDTILIQSTNEYSYAAGDAAQAWSLNGQLARVVGGNDYMTAGYYFQGALAGDVYWQEANTLVEGGDDTLNGGNLRELIAGDVHTMKVSMSPVTARVVGGNDTIHGNGGDDLIAGDLLYMTTASGTVTGGDDVIHGGDGNDHISGDAYSVYYTVTTVTSGDDVIHGGGGSDRIYGDSTDNNQNAVGVGGSDRLYGEDGADEIYGHGGNDILDGGAGADYLSGGDGNDWLSGGADNDRLYGWNGDDQLDGAAGADIMYGGAGNDTYYVNDYGDQVKEYDGDGDGIDTVWSTLGSTYLTAYVENLSFNGVGGFLGIGNGLANVITGGAGTDTLYGADGNDVLIGGGGPDALDGGNGIDTASYASAAEGVDARLLGQGYAGDALGDTYAGVENSDRLPLQRCAFRQRSGQQALRRLGQRLPRRARRQRRADRWRRRRPAGRRPRRRHLRLRCRRRLGAGFPRHHPSRHWRQRLRGRGGGGRRLHRPLGDRRERGCRRQPGLRVRRHRHRQGLAGRLGQQHDRPLQYRQGRRVRTRTRHRGRRHSRLRLQGRRLHSLTAPSFHLRQLER